MPCQSQLPREVRPDTGAVVERMFAQNALMLLRFICRPSFGKQGKQFYLPLETEPPAVQCLDSMSQLIIECQCERDAPENVEKQIIQIRGGEPALLLAALHHD